VFWTARDNLDWAAASLVLLRAFLDQGGQRAVMAGSCAEYDWIGEGILMESSPIRPATPYGVAKDLVRRAVCAANDHFSASVAWGRVFWLYGPQEAAGRLVSDVAAALSEGRPTDVSEGRQIRDFLHVDDVASAFVAALENGWSGPFNIGAGEGVSVRQVIETLAQASGRRDLVRFGARATSPSDPPLLVADTRVLREEFGWAPAISMQQGLALTYDWWKKRASVSDG
jgi:nucleoside-diphosphate-sugar epimerase